MLRLFIILGLLTLTCVSSLSAHAQVQLPEFSISSIPMLESGETQETFNYDTAFSGIKNPFMADTLRLQYQINLLERLIRRQTEIQRIAESYEGVGIPFKQPAPPATACSVLPVNILCMAFYPESPKYKTLIAERREEAERDQRRQMESLMQQWNITPVVRNVPRSSDNSNDQSTVTSQPQQQYTMPPQRPDYVWSDIRCLSGNCSALLENTDDNTLRFRIREGEELPGGSKVTKISSNGVSVIKESESFDLKPKGLGDLPPQSSGAEADEIANILRNQFGTVPTSGDTGNDTELVDSSGDGAIPPQTVEDAGLPQIPLLGPTGLF